MPLSAVSLLLVLTTLGVVAWHLLSNLGRLDNHQGAVVTAVGMLGLVLAQWGLQALSWADAPLALVAVVLGMGHVWRSRWFTPPGADRSAHPSRPPNFRASRGAGRDGRSNSSLPSDPASPASTSGPLTSVPPTSVPPTSATYRPSFEPAAGPPAADMPGQRARVALSVQRSRAAALQAEGRLEEAWQVLAEVPGTELVLDDLDHLASAFEAADSHAQAVAVLERLVAVSAGVSAGRTPPTRTPLALRQRLNLAQQRARAVNTGGQPTPPQEHRLPERLGRYRLERALARGAMGMVYLGHDPSGSGPAGDARVALKTLMLGQEFGGEDLAEARRRFTREAELAARLVHPNIVRILEAGQDAPTRRDGEAAAWLAMEWIRGETLVPSTRADRLLPIDRVLRITERAALALAHAHGLGVVHRDIKPGNIMWDPTAPDPAMTVKVADFGIARVTDGTRTRTGMVLGTPAFMSPEQLAGREIDGRSDIYSLGVTLFQLLCGRLPFQAESLGDLMFRIAHVGAPDVRTVRPDLPEAVAEVVSLALEKRPEIRYADAAQLAHDLAQVADSLGQVIRRRKGELP